MRHLENGNVLVFVRLLRIAEVRTGAGDLLGLGKVRIGVDGLVDGLVVLRAALHLLSVLLARVLLLVVLLLQVLLVVVLLVLVLQLVVLLVLVLLLAQVHVLREAAGHLQQVVVHAVGVAVAVAVGLGLLKARDNDGALHQLGDTWRASLINVK